MTKIKDTFLTMTSRLSAEGRPGLIIVLDASSDKKEVIRETFKIVKREIGLKQKIKAMSMISSRLSTCRESNKMVMAKIVTKSQEVVVICCPGILPAGQKEQIKNIIQRVGFKAFVSIK